MRSFPLSFKKCPSRTDPCLPSVSILVRKTEEIHSQPSSLETFSQLIAIHYSLAFVVQSLSCIQIFATPGTTAHQAFLSFTISWSLLKLMSIESVMPPNHLILDWVFQADSPLCTSFWLQEGEKEGSKQEVFKLRLHTALPPLCPQFEPGYIENEQWEVS